MRKKAGLTLIEIMISFVLILLIALYLMSLFASGQVHWRRAQQYSIASFLVNQKMQQAMQVPMPELTPVSGQFDAPFAEYSYQIDVAPYESHLYTLDVEVVSNGGSRAGARTLLGDNQGFQGVAVDAFTNLVAFATASQVKFASDGSGATPPAALNYSDARAGGAVAGSPGSNLLWQVGQQGGLQKLFESIPSENWGTLAAAVATPAPLSSPRFSGVASDRFGNYAVVADTSNRCLWLYKDPAWVAQPLKPKTVALGTPAGVTMDPYGNLIWVADKDNQCLRKVVLSQPAAGFEADANSNSWWQLDASPIKPPANLGMGSPQGLTMDAYGWAVFVVDQARLYRYVDDTQQWWIVGSFKEDIINEGISGIALDMFGNLLYVNTQAGHCYKLSVSGIANTPTAAPYIPSILDTTPVN